MRAIHHGRASASWSTLSVTLGLTFTPHQFGATSALETKKMDARSQKNARAVEGRRYAHRPGTCMRTALSRKSGEPSSMCRSRIHANITAQRGALTVFQPSILTSTREKSRKPLKKSLKILGNRYTFWYYRTRLCSCIAFGTVKKAVARSTAAFFVYG